MLSRRPSLENRPFSISEILSLLQVRAITCWGNMVGEKLVLAPGCYTAPWGSADFSATIQSWSPLRLLRAALRRQRPLPSLIVAVPQVLIFGGDHVLLDIVLDLHALRQFVDVGVDPLEVLDRGPDGS